MTAYLLLNHAMNFIAPAAFTALVLGVLSRFFACFFVADQAPTPRWLVQVGVNFAIGVSVLLAGLVLLGRDGKMLTYLALVLATATSQWWQLGGYQDGQKMLKLLKKSITRQP